MVKNEQHVANFRRVVARRLRSKTTDPEIVLWKRLRTIEMEGTHFRRQVSIGPYVADFACMAARLVIELDGSQYATDAKRAKDEKRTEWFRFWNNDLSTNMDGVLDTVYAALYGSRDSSPSSFYHNRRKRYHPTPARNARRPSPSRGG